MIGKVGTEIIMDFDGPNMVPLATYIGGGAQETRRSCAHQRTNPERLVRLVEALPCEIQRAIAQTGSTSSPDRVRSSFLAES
jgi:hypothetical protein